MVRADQAQRQQPVDGLRGALGRGRPHRRGRRHRRLLALPPRRAAGVTGRR